MAEFLVAIGSALESVTQVNKYVITPILNQFSYLFNYNNNIQSLSDQVEELNKKRNNLKLEIDAATDNTEEIGGDVTKWLEKVIEINVKKDQIIQDKAQVQQGCCYGKCPNLKLDGTK
ncbi:hypothetical protein M9H77_28325 [Catharanthus roseus]|uniref:Uncharacterized protein n=1 Tax=Catharanthus roseus TaxID=4058 RepID=A0ACC0AF00_CATRO|nr:hypothetical protein M9H77_28325 [Catharanthus roseus]